MQKQGIDPSTKQSCGYWWIIYEYKDKNGRRTNQHNRYAVKSDAKVPPMTGWECAKGGIKPMPVLQPYHPDPKPNLTA